MSSIFSTGPALQALRRLNEHVNALSRTNERLASGQRINHAADDAAGLSISETLKSHTRVYSTAIRNINDGLSSLNIADGALGELTSVLQRMNELSSQAANGTFTLTQRRSLDSESAALTSEFNRLVATTNFNNLNLLNGNQSQTTLQLGFGTNGTISYQLAQYLQHSVGTGSFGAGVSAGSSDTQSLGTADFNNDGMTDIVTQGSGAGTIKLRLATGSGSLATSNLSLLGGGVATSGGIMDGDGDGNLDIFVIETGGTFEYFRGNGDGTFKTAKSVASGFATNPNRMAVADVNSDGLSDIILSASNGNIYSVINQGSGSFSSPNLLLNTGLSATNLKTGDFNGDGKIDFIVNNTGSPTAKVYLGGGSGFTLSATLTNTDNAANIFTGDLNNDGYKDLVLSSGSNTRIRLSNGDGSFADESTISTSFTTHDLKDMNGDGVLDLFGRNGTTAHVLYGNGDGNFSGPQGSTNLNAAVTSVVAGDFDGDGAMDMYQIKNLVNSSVHLAGTQSVSSIERLYLLDREGALSAIEKINDMLERAFKEKGNIGAVMSRLEAALNTVSETALNYEQANSRIRDADIASEAANSVRLQVLQQSAQAVLGQANQSSRIALDLLRF